MSVILFEPQCVNEMIINILLKRHSDVIMSAMASQITGVSIVYSAVCSGTDQRKQQSSASLAGEFQQKGPVTLKMIPFNDVIMNGEGPMSTAWSSVELKWPTFWRRNFQINFLNKTCWFFIEIWLQFSPKGPTNKYLALVQVMDW